jgi:hypothetical protein
MVPSIHDKGTHYVTNHRLTLELLGELAEPEDVLEITGDYTGGLTGIDHHIQEKKKIKFTEDYN